MRAAAEAARAKERFPQYYCPTPRCLWRTGGGYCPRHSPKQSVTETRRHNRLFDYPRDSDAQNRETRFPTSGGI